MTYVGMLPDGTEVCLPQPVRVRFSREEDAPADEFFGVFPLKGMGRGEQPGNLTALRIYDRTGKPCFDGITDEQKMTRANGMFLTLTGRSRAALLLDNEATAQTYCMPSLSMIFQRHIQPYGFTGFRGSGRIVQGSLTVTKGMSEWQAAEQFCRRFLNVEPRVRDGVFDASGEMPKNRILFGTGGNPYSERVEDDRYAERISEVMAQNGTGGLYSRAGWDEEAVRLGIRRKRVLSLGQSAEAVLRTSRKKSFSVRLTCPGEVPVEPLQPAVLEDGDRNPEEELYVAETEYTLDAAGETTRITLRRRD